MIWHCILCLHNVCKTLGTCVWQKRGQRTSTGFSEKKGILFVDQSGVCPCPCNTDPMTMQWPSPPVLSTTGHPTEDRLARGSQWALTEFLYDDDVELNVLGCRVDILGTNCDQCVCMVQCCFTSTETIMLIRTGSLGQPPRLSHSSWTLEYRDWQP